MNNFTILLIKVYQKYISPYKGFRCAHAYLYDGTSCSEEVMRIIQSEGVIQGSDKIRYRFQACHDAYLSLSAENKRSNNRKKNNSGLDRCDSASACDIAECAGQEKYCDMADFCECSIF